LRNFKCVILTEHYYGGTVEECGRCEWKRNACRVWRGKVKYGAHFEEPGIDGRIILKWILRK